MDMPPIPSKLSSSLAVFRTQEVADTLTRVIHCLQTLTRVLGQKSSSPSADLLELIRKSEVASSRNLTQVLTSARSIFHASLDAVSRKNRPQIIELRAEADVLLERIGSHEIALNLQQTAEINDAVQKLLHIAGSPDRGI
jgi:hypothetical protein